MNCVLYFQSSPILPSYIPDENKVPYIYKNQSINIKDTSTWPSHDVLKLNESQLDALKNSLTRKFTVIQGPPGTGKTFMGLEIISTLLQNTDAQILIVSYTNHALDQFLTGILKHTDSIVRIGNQSRNELLDRFNLSQLYDSYAADSTLKSNLYKLRCEYTFAIQRFTELQTQMKEHPEEDRLINEYLYIQVKQNTCVDVFFFLITVGLFCRLSFNR